MEERFQIFTCLMLNINRCIYKLKTEEMTEFNLKSSHVSCIYYIFKYNSLTAKQLCNLCGEDKANISRTLRYLEKQEYLNISDDSNKKYNKLIELSPKGNEIGRRLNESIDKILNYASEGLSVENRNIIYQGLSLINERLTKLCREKNWRK